LGLIDDIDTNRFTILGSLTRLRQLSLDPSLVDEAHAGVPASKIDVLAEHLNEVVQEGHKALVFSQFTGFLHKIRKRLEVEGISYAYLDGSTRNRGAVVEEFRSGSASVFLISLKAGGFGLNLTEADYCYVLDPWWNPAAEAQAVDRTHRIGQTKTVMVYRLVAQGTIEEKVMELKARKSKLFDSVLGDDALGGAALTAEEIRGLLG
jgi:SNF2 family DNA or RNA helicase